MSLYTANINAKTGIPFGIISANKLDSEIVDSLLYGLNVIDHSYNDYLKEAAKENGFKDEENETFVKFCEDGGYLFEDITNDHLSDYLNFVEFDFDNVQIDEMLVEGNYHDVEYSSSWIGGALHFFITSSPVIVDNVRECSLCVPNAGNLDQIGEGSYQCYGVPSD